MFASMLESLKYEVISTLSKVQVRMPEEVEAMEQQRREEAERLAQMQQLSHQAFESSLPGLSFCTWISPSPKPASLRA